MGSSIPMGAGARTFEQCYAAARPRVVAALAITSGDADLAQECADEAFARALGRWERLTVGDAPVEPWVYRVALNHLRRTMRRRGIERRLLIRTWRPSLPAIPHPEVWIAVAALPRRQREVVLLRYVADLTDAGIAATLGISRGTVSSTLVDAHRALARLLGDDVAEEELTP